MGRSRSGVQPMKRWQARLSAWVLFILGVGSSWVNVEWLSLLAFAGAWICVLYLIATRTKGSGPLRPGW